MRGGVRMEGVVRVDRPVGTAVRLAAGLIAAGLLLAAAAAHAETGFVGLEVQGIGERAAAVLPSGYTSGVLVKNVAVGEPGAIAGVRRGDVIVEFDGKTVASFEDLLKGVAGTEPGDTIRIVVLRAGEKVDLVLHTTVRPPAWSVSRAAFHNYPDLGVTVATLTEKVRQTFSVPWGTNGLVVTVVDQNGPAASGLARGDVIVQTNMHDVWEPGHLTHQIEDARKAGRSGVLLLVATAGAFRYAVLPVK